MAADCKSALSRVRRFESFPFHHAYPHEKDSVETLVNQAAKATEEITGQILGIREGTEQTVLAVAGISQIIEPIHDFSTMVANAVTEQSAATRGIAPYVQKAAAQRQRS